MVSSNRRVLCRSVLCGAVGVLLACPVFAQSSPSSLSVTQLGEQLFQVSGAGANVVVLSQPDGLLLVNGGSREHSTELVALLNERFKGARIKVLFNTDWHPENTGLNETVGAAGGRIIAHENTKLWLGTEIVVQWQQDKKYKPLVKTALPNSTFYTDATLTFGSETVRYGYLGQAHTDGDIYVYFPTANVLVAGDVVSVGSYPVLDYSTGGWVVGLAGATRTLLAVGNADTRVVPGNGAVQPRAHLQAQAEMLNTMRDRLIKLMKSGLGPDEIVTAAPTKEFDDKWGNPELFLKNAYPGIWWHVREVGGVV